MASVHVQGFKFDKVLICGVGLIGGSLARALRKAHRDGRIGGRGQIVGVDRDAASLAQAEALDVIDMACVLGKDPTAPNNFAEMAADADLIVLAVPVAQARALLSLAAPVLSEQAVLTDVGSTKQSICDAAALLLGARFSRFVGGHPIAGGEKSGVGAACDGLFVGKHVVLCPLPDMADAQEGTHPAALARVEAMWQAVGGRTAIMTPQQHDQVFAAVSHMPHLLAFAFIEHILQSDDPSQRLVFAGSGFRDFTRIAASNPEMWRDICLANRESLLNECDHFMGVLAGLRAAVAAGDANTLEAVFNRARESRSAWQQGDVAACAAKPEADQVASSEANGRPAPGNPQ